MIDLRLFSSPGENDIHYIVEASRPYLSGKPDASLAYLPQASLSAQYRLDDTRRAFDGLASVEVIDTERMDLAEMEAVIRRAHIAYIPGGNTFLLNHRLHISRLMAYLRKKVQAGLPVVAFSAGTILCGPNILTASDLNTVGTPHFEGLSVAPFNFFAHYSKDAYGQSVQDAWLSDYFIFNDNPVIMLADGAYVTVEGRKTSLARGEAWIIRKPGKKELLQAGKQINLEETQDG